MNAPSVLEVNTAVWLDGLGLRLDTLKERELEVFAGRDYVWMMGVWERSEAGQQIARTHSGLQQEFYAALNDYTVDDVIGSAYAVRAYRVDRRLGSKSGLANVRKILHERFGVKLILDFIPNHCAVDGDWPHRHPEWFISGHGRGESETFQVGTHRLAHGRDPFFAPWTDTAQYDYSTPEFRKAMIAELLLIAEHCDGVRCDMAMLMLQDVFTQTWDRDPKTEFWVEAIKTVKARFPNFLFVAEAYWNREWQLLQLGFDFCYDKTLYDRLRTRDAHSIAAHLQADVQFASRANAQVMRQKQIHRLRHVISQLTQLLPDDVRARAEVRELAAYGCVTRMHVVRLLAPMLAGEDHTKDIDFSADGIRQRWEAGYRHTCETLEKAPWRAEVDPSEGFVLHEACAGEMVETVAAKM